MNRNTTLALAAGLLTLASLPSAAALAHAVTVSEMPFADAPKPALVDELAHQLHLATDGVVQHIGVRGLPMGGGNDLPVLYAYAGFDAYCDSRIVPHPCWGYAHGYHGGPPLSTGTSSATDYGHSSGTCGTGLGFSCESNAGRDDAFFANEGDCIFFTAQTVSAVGVATDMPPCERV